ncbi:class II aldolase protein [Azotobacter vinelandii CA]|uniref:Class II aldolase protein n=2 Tax=Azotobacter vinelandii TaxID=354 RepID=C1DGM2_AZOVD|nr:class II aldolase/adducin family protein [Azotobacter vinelandii]ACO80518.1 class II aldolase protein [Azotobacter vinelandii DJ]AGK14374.1 class II aldolase protein [Azotobacter vinelandii CA]AGK21970.1 class II aldolase protein [Azotobacter vinelandii CA6]WKN21282.1 class II aldolase/adducin family protein [Azotobacter vinelandii]SFX36120.1 Ribulose-5-phosphate 4-epimerase/Fuculose-1-phosphate aldolase [Azotobacter vinelandii]
MPQTRRFPQSIYALPLADNRLRLDRVPRQADPLAERLHRRQRLAGAFRLFARLGFEVGVAGHFTARDPIETDHYWINPLGVPFSQLRVSHLLRVDGEGRVVEGDGPLNSGALKLHYHLQKARPEVVGIAHLHGLHGRAWSALGRPFEPLTAESAAFSGSQAIFRRHDLRDEQGNPERRPERLTRAFVDSFADNDLLIWQNHGLWTTGASVESAAWRSILADDSARTHLLAYAAGRPVIPDAALAAASIAPDKELADWLNFLPLWDRISAEEPDLLD